MRGEIRALLIVEERKARVQALEVYEFRECSASPSLTVHWHSQRLLVQTRMSIENAAKSSAASNFCHVCNETICVR